ncbi:MAG: acetylglutamate kinase [Lachnospiraceae bacterium]|nr:acetylglutamate kinase [Lachnospiraceae bacterium]MBR6274924.1 acetylglutamate kinase [Lachnospiraceae bacterium]
MSKEFNREEILKKASILIDAMPYIRDFAGKIVVICLSLSKMPSEEAEISMMQDIALLQSIGMKPIVVHDCKNKADRYRENKRIAKEIEHCKVKAIGVCGIDFQTLNISMQNDYIPVITPNDVDTEDKLIYPEDTACEIAVGLGAEKLVFLSEDAGIFDDGKLLPMVMRNEAENLLKKGAYGEAFARRLKNSLIAIDKGVGRAHIIDCKVEHGLLLEFFSVDGIGTVIMKDHSKYYPHEKNFRF